MSMNVPYTRSAAVSRPPSRLLFGSALLLVLALSACSDSKRKDPEATKPEATKPEATKPDVVAATNVDPSVCLANPEWITSPTMPSEVAASETFCDFYQFSWQWFLAQVSPANPAHPDGERVFETNRVFDPTVKSNQCGGPVLTGRATAAKLIAARVSKPQDFEDVQADGNALYDQDGNILYYNIWYSQAECQSTTAGFAPGTMEIKVAWKILSQPDPSYFMMKARVPGGTGEVTLGLVGFHLVNWTSKHPEMIWATFEHKSNAPLCNGSSATSGWSLASDAAAQCLADNKQPNSGPPNAKCASFGFNTAATISGTPPATGTANEICREYANGNQSGAAINGNDNAANLLAIRELNTELIGPQGLLTTLPGDNPMAVWQNYEMIGGLWTKDGAASGSAPVPHVGGEPDPNSPQRGSLELTNMTMETFEQGDTSYVPNCFGCHNYKPETPLTVSHIEKQLFE